MIKEVKSALDQLCKEILNTEKSDLSQLVNWSRELYEYLIILSYLKNSKEADSREEVKERISNLNVDTKELIETNEHTVKHQVVSLTDEAENAGKIFNKIENQKYNIEINSFRADTIKGEKINVDTGNSPELVSKNRILEKTQKSASDIPIGLNERLATNANITLGLNDKIAFTKHLFRGDEDKLMNFVSQINHFTTFEEAIKLFNQKKAENLHWEEKKEYLTRFENLIRRKFGKPEIMED